MRLALSFCVAVLSALPCRAQSAAQPPGAASPLRLTERDAIARLAANDPRLRALNARIEEVRATQAERTLWPNPSATFSRESVLNAHDTFVLARQELPISGRRADLQTAGRFAVDAAQAEARYARILLQTDMRDAYTSLLLAQEREAAVQDALATLDKLVSVLRTREQGGEGSAYDRMRGQRALVDLQAERALAGADRARAQGLLAGYLGPAAPPDTLFAADTLTAATSLPALPALVEQALANRGDYRSAELSIARFEAERAAANRLKVPIPSVTGGLKRSAFAGTTGSGYQVSVDLSMPLFSRGQAAAALATAQQARAQAEAESWRLRIAAEVTAAHSVLRIQQERAARYQEATAAIAEPLAQVGRVGYEEGELSILELLDAERQALDARLQVLDLAAAARRAAIDLDRAIGQEFRP